MTSKAERKRTHKAARASVPVAPRPKPDLRIVTDLEPRRQKTGLEWMVAKKKLNQQQLMAGMRYGKHYRLAEVADMEPLRSCLNDEPGGGAGLGLIRQPSTDIDARANLLAARQALTFHAEMIAACDMICGRGWTPWEIIDRAGGGQKEVEKLQHSLGIALDILHAHYRLTK